jgi:prevent-host-death family protein
MQVETVGAYEAKTRFFKLLERVRAGEEVTITRHGSPVAKLVPVKWKATPDERAAAIKRMQKRAARLSLGDVKTKQLLVKGRK